MNFEQEIATTQMDSEQPKFEVASFDEIAERITKIWDEVFVEKYLKDTERLGCKVQWDTIEIGLNQYALAAAIGNALIDLERWCSFHLRHASKEKGAPLPDHHKYAGFVAKWLAKERPIYIRELEFNNFHDLPQQLYRINALFALVVMQSYLESAIPHPLFEELFYILHFREEKGETLALLAYCAEEIGRQQAKSISETAITERSHL